MRAPLGAVSSLGNRASVLKATKINQVKNEMSPTKHGMFTIIFLLFSIEYKENKGFCVQ